MVALIPLLADYLENRYQLSVQEILLPLAVNMVAATVISLLFYRMWRHNRLGAYTAAILATAFVTTSYDQRITAIMPSLQAILPLPNLGDGFYSLVFLAGLLLACYWLGRAVARLAVQYKWNIKNILTGVSIAIAVTFLLELIPAVRDLALAWPQFFYKPPALASAPKAASMAAKPDIYYIMLDDYASPEILKSQFGYDMSDFTQFLSDNGFYIPSNSHQLYPYTTMSLASTMTANYNSDMIRQFAKSSEQTIIPYNLAVRNSPVANHLKSLGYSYNLIGNWYETSNLSPLANHQFGQEGLLTLFGHTFILDNFPKQQLSESVIWKFLPPKLMIGKFNLLGYVNASTPDMTLASLQELKSAINQPPGGRFIFAHFLVPHEPYYFNADGSISRDIDGDNTGKPIKQKYVDQVKFINNKLKDIISSIKRQSQGQAVVLLQSDEGPSPLDLNDSNFDQMGVQDALQNTDMRDWSDADLQLKYGNLAAYAVPAANPADLGAGTSSVNVFRLVFNSYFGENLPYLADCFYAYPNGRSQPFVYANINQRLTGQTNALCNNDGTGPK